MTDPLADPAVPAAWLGGHLATGLRDVSDDLSVLDTTGRWAVCVDFYGNATLARFDHWRPMAPTSLPGGWHGPAHESWESSLDEPGYRAAVAAVRAAISRGDVYQANICRVMSAPAPAGSDPFALAAVLAAGNPAPYAGALRLPAEGGRAAVAVACASPELYLSRRDGMLLSRPIKGTAREPGGFLDKDYAENVMIVDLVRNDLSAVAVTGSVEVPEFLAEEAHPGLVHLVSGVSARVRPTATWVDIFAATFPPGSVTGAPKSSALRIIAELEPVPRGPYCGAFGWVDADTGEAELAVAIRTFWWQDGRLCFGTGAGITWGSEAGPEWRETELKAAKLVGLASAARERGGSGTAREVDRSGAASQRGGGSSDAAPARGEPR